LSILWHANTYALVEILKGNPLYKKYAEEDLITSELNLLELIKRRPSRY